MRSVIFAFSLLTLTGACAPPPPPAWMLEKLASRPEPEPRRFDIDVTISNQLQFPLLITINKSKATSVVLPGHVSTFVYSAVGFEAPDSVTVTAEPVRALDTPGRFAPIADVDDSESVVFRRNARVRVNASYGYYVVGSSAYFTQIQFDSSSIAEPKALTNVEALLAKLARLRLERDALKDEVDALTLREVEYRLKLRELAEELTHEKAARARAEKMLVDARAQLAAAQRASAAIPPTVKADLDGGTLSASTVSWAVGETETALLSQRSRVCKQVVVGGAHLAVGLSSLLLPEMSVLGRLAATVLYWAAGEAFDGYLQKLADGMCRS